MKSHRASLLCVIGMVVLTGMVTAQSVITQAAGEHSNEKYNSGDGAYTVTCSVGASAGLVICGELPSGKKAQKDQDAADASAAVAAVQQIQTEAGDVSTSISKALQNPQNQDSQDSADTSAALAAVLQKVKQAADTLTTSTPDVFVITRPYTREPSQEKVPAYTFPQRVLAWGIEGIPGQETQNTPPEASSNNQSVEDQSKQNLQAADQDQMNHYYDSLQKYQQAIQQTNDLILQQGAKNRIPPPNQVQQANGPQLKKNTNTNCSGSNATALCSNH